MSAAAIVLEILGGIAGEVLTLVTAGTAKDRITSGLRIGLEAATTVARERIESRNDGKPVQPLLVLALRGEDYAHALVAEHQPILAAEVALVVAELRKRAAATAPTDPAPASDR